MAGAAAIRPGAPLRRHAHEGGPVCGVRLRVERILHDYFRRARRPMVGNGDNPTDPELLRRMRLGDESALEALYVRYRGSRVSRRRGHPSSTRRVPGLSAPPRAAVMVRTSMASSVSECPRLLGHHPNRRRRYRDRDLLSRRVLLVRRSRGLPDPGIADLNSEQLHHRRGGCT